MYIVLLCQRYLRTRYIALASIISVMLGVATMIVVNSVMAGFSTEMRNRIHGILADLVLESSSLDGFSDVERHKQLIREAAGDYIDAMSPTVEIYGMLSFQYVGQWITRPVTLIGIEPESKAQVGTLKEHLGNYQDVRDADGHVVRLAAKGLDVPPNWELLDEYLKYRRARIEEQKILNDDDAEAAPRAQGKSPVRPVAGEDEKAGVEPIGVENPFESLDAPKNSALEDPFRNEPPKVPAADPASPLRGRLYVGAGLIGFAYEDRETKRLKTVMMVQPGDDVKISTVNSGRPPAAVHFNATVVDTFKSGMSEYDSNLVFVNLDYLQEVRGMIDPASNQRAVTTIQIKLKDFRDAPKVVERLRGVFPPGMYSVRTWEQKQGPLLAAVAVESAILNVLLFLIIAVAGFGILAIFFMIVVEKTRDIGILKALGASSNGIMTIFLTYGLGLGIVGSGVGVLMGLLFVHYINEIEAILTWLTGIEVFDEKIYYFPTIPTHVSPVMVICVALGAMAIAVLASVLPARRAALLRPVQALRYE